MTKSPLKKPAFLLLALVAVLCVLWVTELIPASGGYRITKNRTASSAPGAAGWAEISPFLPLLHLYGEAGESPLSVVWFGWRCGPFR